MLGPEVLMRQRGELDVGGLIVLLFLGLMAYAAWRVMSRNSDIASDRQSSSASHE